MAHRVDINTATADELNAIPALKGDGFAIVRYRGERGRFHEVRQLEEVPGTAGHTQGLEDILKFD